MGPSDDEEEFLLQNMIREGTKQQASLEDYEALEDDGTNISTKLVMAMLSSKKLVSQMLMPRYMLGIFAFINMTRILYVCTVYINRYFFQTSGSRKPKWKRGSKRKMEGRTNITLLGSDGEPKARKGVDRTMVNQYGYYIRENIPISCKLWTKNKTTDNDADVVPDTEKEILWREVKQHFNFSS
jgi:hypothetical protein